MILDHLMANFFVTKVRVIPYFFGHDVSWPYGMTLTDFYFFFFFYVPSVSMCLFYTSTQSLLISKACEYLFVCSLKLYNLCLSNFKMNEFTN